MSEKMKDEWQGGQTVSESLWQVRISILPHSLESFEIWITFSNHISKFFEVWFKSLTHNVEKTERLITILTLCVDVLMAQKESQFCLKVW